MGGWWGVGGGGGVPMIIVTSDFIEIVNCYWLLPRVNEIRPCQYSCCSLIISRVFDEDKSGTLDFMEFTMAINCTNLTQPEDKLRFVGKVLIRNVFQTSGSQTTSFSAGFLMFSTRTLVDSLTPLKLRNWWLVFSS